MVTKENRLIVPRGYRDGTYIGDNDVHKKIATAKRPDGGIAVLTSFFPDYPYYGVALCGSLNGVSSNGWRESGEKVIQTGYDWYAWDDSDENGGTITDVDYPSPSSQSSTADIRFDGGSPFGRWFIALPLHPFNTYTYLEGFSSPTHITEIEGGFRSQSKTYARVDQESYCVRAQPHPEHTDTENWSRYTCDKPRVLDFCFELERDNLYYLSDWFSGRIYRAARSSCLGCPAPKPATGLVWAKVEYKTDNKDAGGDYSRLLYENFRSRYMSPFDDVYGADVKECVNPSPPPHLPPEYHEYWPQSAFAHIKWFTQGAERYIDISEQIGSPGCSSDIIPETLYDYNKPVRHLTIDTADNKLNWQPDIILAGKVCEPLRSCVYKAADLVSGGFGYGFCVKRHKVLYYKLPFVNGEEDNLAAAINVTICPDDIVVRKASDSPEVYKAYKCTEPDYNLQCFSDGSARGTKYTLIWIGESYYENPDDPHTFVHALFDTTHGFCPYGNAEAEYITPATEAEVKNFVISALSD